MTTGWEVKLHRSARRIEKLKGRLPDIPRPATAPINNDDDDNNS
jgi:hypothetical protein